MINFPNYSSGGLYESCSSEEALRVVQSMDFWNSSSLTTPPAHFDPIFTPFFVSIGFTGSIGIGAVSISTAAIASAIATTAISIGIQMLLAPKPPAPEDGKIPLTQSLPHRQWVVGRTRVAGAYMLMEAKGAKLYCVQAIAGHRISAVNRYYLHDDEVEIDGSGWVQGLTDLSYNNNTVQIGSRLGLATETAYSFISDDLTAEGVWTASHRGDGQASLGMVCLSPKSTFFTTVYPYGAPRLSVEVDGALVWDYRDPAQSPTNPATWTWSRNAALIMCWHQCFNEFGHRRDYTKAILPVLYMWEEEADICDEDVALAAGGTEKRYLVSGFDTAENDPKVGTNAILSACDGWICERGDGALLLTVGKYRESRVATITDADITGYQLQNDVLPEEACNKLVPTFTYPATDYATSDTDAFEDVAAQLIEGRPLTQKADYTWCHQWRQARRLGIRDWRRLQQKIKGSIDVRLSGINAIYSRWVRLSTPLGLPRLNGAVIENRRSILALTKGGFSMDFIKHPEGIDDWVPSEDEGAQPPVPSKPNAADLDTPVVTSIVAYKGSGSVYLKVTVEDPESEDLSLAIRYRVADQGGSPGEWVKQIFTDFTPSGGFVVVNTNPVPTDTELDVQAAWITAKGKYSDWSPTETIETTLDTTAPKSLTSFTDATGGAHLGNAPLGFVTKSDTHLNRIALYRAPTGVTLNKTTHFVDRIGAAPGTTFTYTDGDTPASMLSNGGFSSDTVWTKGTGWTIGSGVATKAAGTASNLDQAVSLTVGDVIRYSYDVTSYSAGNVRFRLEGTTSVLGIQAGAAGTFRGSVTVVTGNNTVRMGANSAFAGTVDNVYAYAQTVDCAPQGVWDYYAIPENISGKPGPQSGPLTITII